MGRRAGNPANKKGAPRPLIANRPEEGDKSKPLQIELVEAGVTQEIEDAAYNGGQPWQRFFCHYTLHGFPILFFIGGEIIKRPPGIQSPEVLSIRESDVECKIILITEKDLAD